MIRITCMKNDGNYEHRTGDSFAIINQCLMVDRENIGPVTDFKTVCVTRMTHPKHHPEAPDGYASGGCGLKDNHEF